MVDFVFTAAALTIVVEALAAIAMRRQRTVNGVTTSTGRTVTAVLGGNVLSSVALLFLLVWMLHLYPPRHVYETECRGNVGMLREAALQYQMASDAADGAPLTREALLPYLPDKKWPTCPFNGTYRIDRAGQKPECSHGPSDKPVRDRKDPDKMPGRVR